MIAFEAAPPDRRGGLIPARASVALRLRVYMTRGGLDRQIADGRPCESTAALALRARQLVHPHTLQRITGELRGVVDYVDRVGSRRVISAVVIERRAVADGRRPILRLAERIEETAQVSPRGVALAQTLLTDGLGPLFNRHSERSVAEAVCLIEDALEANAPMSGFGVASL